MNTEITDVHGYVWSAQETGGSPRDWDWRCVGKREPVRRTTHVEVMAEGIKSAEAEVNREAGFLSYVIEPLQDAVRRVDNRLAKLETDLLAGRYK